MKDETENAARTLVRIEAIALQGIVLTILKCVFILMILPYFPFLHFFRLVAEGFRRFTFWKALLMIVPYLFVAIFSTLILPFVVLSKDIADIIRVSRAEWENGQGRASKGNASLLPQVLTDYGLVDENGEVDI